MTSIKNQMNEDNETILIVQGVKTHFFTYAGVVKALNGINLSIKRNETLAIVGETGSGKSITAHSIMRLVRTPGKIIEGNIYYRGDYSKNKWINLLTLPDREIRKIRGHYITMIFQDPMTYLNPVFKIGNQITESIILHQDLRERVVKYKIKLTKKLLDQDPKKPEELTDMLSELKEQLKDPPEPTSKDRNRVAEIIALDTLKLVRMPYPENVLNSYPFELSGGMRQRVMIAIALSSRPELLIADEATTALDVTIQAQVLELLAELKDELGTTLVIITHDLGIVAEQTERVLVMYGGNIIEEAPTKELFKNPNHPYTKGLLAAIPRLGLDKLPIIPGTVPNLIDPPSGCRFHPRCPDRIDICDKELPPFSKISEGHFVACHVHGSDDIPDPFDIMLHLETETTI